jgi:hypothetical protein
MGEVMKKGIIITMILLNIFLGACYYGETGEKGTRRKDTIAQYELIALTNKTATTGRVFLLSGTINEQAVFYFYYKKGDAILLKSISANMAEIYETDVVEPYVELDTYSYPDFNGGSTHIRSAKFYIPQNSIVSDYTLDLTEIKK